MKRLFTFMLFICAASALTFTQAPSADEQTLLKLDQEFITAMLKNDGAALERLTDNSYQGFNQFGQSNDRAGFLTVYKTMQTSALSTSNVKVKLAGDTALVSGKQRETSTSNFGREQFLTFLHVWVKRTDGRADGWKMLVKQQQFDLAEGTVTPAGWSGQSNAYFLIGTDSNVKRNGQASAFLKSKHSENTMGGTGLSQQLKAEAYRGKRIRLTGYAKGEVNLGLAFPWLRVDDAEGEVLSFDNSLAQAYYLRPDWQQFSIVLDVPAQSAALFLGFRLNGRGHVWLDDWQLEVVSRDVPVTHQPQSEAQQKMMANDKLANKAQFEQFVQAMKTRLPTLPAAPVNLDFEGGGAQP